MGLHEKTQSNTQFLVVKHGGICLESKEEREGFEPITVDNPRTGQQVTKYIKRFASVDGRISRIEWYDTADRYETRYMGIKIHLKDGGEYFQLDLPFESRPYDVFTYVMDSIDFSKAVEFTAWKDRRTDKTAFVVKQDGQNLQWNYTRENPGDCPPATQSQRTGKWDFTQRKEWLLDRLLNVVVPKVEANSFTDPEPDYTEDDVQIQEVPLVNKAAAPSQLKQDLMSRDKAKSAARSMTGPTDPYEDAPPPDDFVF